MKRSFARAWHRGAQGLVFATAALRLAAASLLDPTFHLDPRVTGRVDVLALQQDGKILAAGVFTNYTPTQQALLVRLEPDGSLSPTFTPLLEQAQPDEYWGTRARVTSIAVTSAGQIALAREYWPGGLGHPLHWHTDVQVLEKDGAIVHGFSLNNTIVRLAVDPEDRLIAGGVAGFQVVGLSIFSHPTLFRLSLAGVPDPSLVPPGEVVRGVGGWTTEVRNIFVARNGDLLLAGSFVFDPGFSPDTTAIRLKPTGELVWTVDWRKDYPAYADQEITSIAEDDSGELTLLGKSILRLTAAGVLSTNFSHPRFDSWLFPRPMVFEPSGRLLVFGSFLHAGGAARAGLVALDRNGVPDPDFDPGTGFGVGNNPNAIMTAIRQPDGKILVGGSFTGFDGMPRPSLVRLLSRNPVEPPSLAVMPTGSGFVVSWTESASGFVLETAAILNGEANWQQSPASVIQEDGVFKATLPTTDSARFFRLRK